ncbi:MAG: DUF4388 domain-containing protein [Planctomycetota bacterium]|jgi:tetratricopeptide (TPR) repeat protein
MTFRGELASISLADVFQNLKNNRQTGTLKIFTPEEAKWIYFLDGDVACAAAGKEPKDCLNHLLVNAGMISEEKLIQLLTKKGKRTLSELLVKEGILDGKSCYDGLRTYIEELIFECFMWEDALFEFSEGPAPENLFPEALCAANIGLQSDSLMMEAARRMDEWSEIKSLIPSSHEMFQLTQEGRAAVESWSEDDQAARAVAMEFRQPTEFATVMELHHLSRFDGGRIVAFLLKQRYLRPLGKEELIEKADAATSADDHPTARTYLARVLDREPGNSEAREKLVHVLASLGDWDEAASQAKILAKGYRDNGDITKAIAAFEQAVSFVPSDTSGHEVLVDMYIKKNRREDAIHASRVLDVKYSELGMPGKAADVYRKVLEKWPKEVDVSTSLGENLASAGKTLEAAAALRGAARLYQRAGNERALEKVLERILELDPNDVSTSRRLKRVRTGALGRKRIAKRFLRIGLLILFILAVLAFFAYREVRALLDERRTLLEAYRLISEKHYDEAPAHYRVFMARHPFTLATMGASAKADEIENLAKRAELEDARLRGAGKLKPDISGSDPGEHFIDKQVKPKKNPDGSGENKP